MIPPGTRVGNLVIGALLGRGGMGEVYAAEQVSLRRPVAVKRIADHLADTPDAIRRFEREAQMVARLRSEHVVGIYELGSFADEAGRSHVLLLMELVDGGLSLKRLLTRPLPWAQAASLMRQATEGLIAAAEHGIVHRDIKPDNILLTRRGVAKLTDFGLAKALDSSAMTLGGSIMGTPAYMAPEVCRGSVADARSDLYSLGATWFHLLTGRTPYTSETTLGMLRAHIEEPIPELRGLAADVPAPIAALVALLLAKDPAQRPASAAELAAAIDALGLPVPRAVPELAARFVSAAEAPTIMPTPLTQVPGSAPTVVATPTANAPTQALPPSSTSVAPSTPTPPPAALRPSRLPLLLAMVAVAIAAAVAGAWFAGRPAAAALPPPTGLAVASATPAPDGTAPVDQPVRTSAPMTVTAPSRPAQATGRQPIPTAPVGATTPSARPPPLIEAPAAIAPVPAAVHPSPARPPAAVVVPAAAPANPAPVAAPAPAPAAAAPVVAPAAVVATPVAVVDPAPAPAPAPAKPSFWRRLNPFGSNAPAAPPAPPPDGAPAPAPVVPATSSEALLVQMDAAVTERRYGDLQLLATTLGERRVLPEAKDQADPLWKSEEKRCAAELDRIEDLIDDELWSEAAAALGGMRADPAYATRKTAARHGELAQSLADEANATVTKALGRGDEMIADGERADATEEFRKARPAAVVVGRQAEIDRALARAAAP